MKPSTYTFFLLLLTMCGCIQPPPEQFEFTYPNTWKYKAPEISSFYTEYKYPNKRSLNNLKNPAVESACLKFMLEQSQVPIIQEIAVIDDQNLIVYTANRKDKRMLPYLKNFKEQLEFTYDNKLFKFFYYRRTQELTLNGYSTYLLSEKKFRLMDNATDDHPTKIFDDMLSSNTLKSPDTLYWTVGGYRFELQK